LSVGRGGKNSKLNVIRKTGGPKNAYARIMITHILRVPVRPEWKFPVCGRSHIYAVHGLFSRVRMVGRAP